MEWYDQQYSNDQYFYHGLYTR